MTEQSRGRFVWFDLNTTNTDGAAAFYSAVTGWGTMPWEGPNPYTLWTNNGVPIGGMMPLESGGAPHWLAYISTPDVDKTLEDAADLGARVLMPAADIPTVGRFAIVADPQGAVFAPFTPLSGPAVPESEPAVGEFSWQELATHDHPAAFRFYERLFGWEKLEAMDMGPAGIYQMFGRNGRMVGGMFDVSPEMPAPPGWLHYVRVNDVQVAADTVKSQGGQVLNGPMDVPGGDSIAQCTDPQGARFAIHQKR